MSEYLVWEREMLRGRGGKGGLSFGARTRAGPGRVGRGGDADISVSILRRMLMEWTGTILICEENHLHPLDALEFSKDSHVMHTSPS